MKRLILLLPFVVLVACGQPSNRDAAETDSRYSGGEKADNRLFVADACTQAANAEIALAAEIRAGKLTAERVEQVAAAKAVVDTLCLDQSAVASSAALTARLRAVVPVIVNLVVKE